MFSTHWKFAFLQGGYNETQVNHTRTVTYPIGYSGILGVLITEISYRSDSDWGELTQKPNNTNFTYYQNGRSTGSFWYSIGIWLDTYRQPKLLMPHIKSCIKHKSRSCIRFDDIKTTSGRVSIINIGGVEDIKYPAKCDWICNSHVRAATAADNSPLVSSLSLCNAHNDLYIFGINKNWWRFIHRFVQLIHRLVLVMQPQINSFEKKSQK